MTNILIYLTGLLMALADTMPGLSGGTICFIMGYYDKFLQSISGLKDKATRKASIIFLLKMGAGWIIGLVVGVLVMEKLLGTHPYAMISFFLGLVLASIPLTFKDEQQYLKDYKNIIFAVIGFILVVGIALASNSLEITISGELQPWVYAYGFVVAMIAISAMLLPGISGSTILLIFGIYQLVITNVKLALTSLNPASILFIVCIGMGILIGGYFFAKLVSNAFKNHRSRILYLILGLLLGSLVAIYMSAPLIESADGVNFAPFDFSKFNMITFILGFCAIIGIDFLKNVLKKKD